MKDIINKLKPFVVQIATPFSTGTGFYAPSHRLIITNEHVVRGSRQIVIQTSDQNRVVGAVVYIDKQNDLAFVKSMEHDLAIEGNLNFVDSIEIGNEIIALGHPYGLSFSSTFGIISNTDLDVEGVSYLMHDAALNPGNSGGPLINRLGEIVGMNSSIFKEGKNIGVALHAKLVLDAIEEYTSSGLKKATRCPSCKYLIKDTIRSSKSCTSCGVKVDLISTTPAYQPVGIAKKVEDIIQKLGYEAVTCRRGQNSWEMIKGSATIFISYHAKSGYLLAECKLCKIPAENTLDLYQFLLEANYKTNGLTFSVKDNNIVLSLLIYDQHLQEEATLTLINYLLKTADDYDDILVDEFNASWN